MNLDAIRRHWQPWSARWRSTPRGVRRVVVVVVGGGLVVAGVAMVVLPGPAILVIPAGVAVLASEFQFVRRWLVRARQRFPSLRRIHGRHPRVAAASPPH